MPILTGTARPFEEALEEALTALVAAVLVPVALVPVALVVDAFALAAFDAALVLVVLVDDDFEAFAAAAFVAEAFAPVLLAAVFVVFAAVAFEAVAFAAVVFTAAFARDFAGAFAPVLLAVDLLFDAFEAAALEAVWVAVALGLVADASAALLLPDFLVDFDFFTVFVGMAFSETPNSLINLYPVNSYQKDRHG